MPAPLDQSRREKRLTVLRNSGSLAEAAMLLKISVDGLRKWMKGEGLEPDTLFFKTTPGPRAHKVPEHLTMSAAEALAKRIEAYWRDRGYKVTCEVVHAGAFYDNISYFAVRSDMINGRPARLARRGA